MIHSLHHESYHHCPAAEPSCDARWIWVSTGPVLLRSLSCACSKMKGGQAAKPAETWEIQGTSRRSEIKQTFLNTKPWNLHESIWDLKLS